MVWIDDDRCFSQELSGSLSRKVCVGGGRFFDLYVYVGLDFVVKRMVRLKILVLGSMAMLLIFGCGKVKGVFFFCDVAGLVFLHFYRIVREHKQRKLPCENVNVQKLGFGSMAIAFGLEMRRSGGMFVLIVRFGFQTLPL